MSERTTASALTGVDPLTKPPCGDLSQMDIYREAERSSRLFCKEPKIMKLRRDGTPYSNHASTATLRRGGQTREELTAKDQKVLRKFEETPLNDVKLAGKREADEGTAATLDGESIVELRMPALDTSAQSAPSASGGKVIIQTPKRVAFDLNIRTESKSATESSTASDASIYDAEMAKKHGSRRPSTNSVPASQIWCPTTGLYNVVSPNDKMPALANKRLIATKMPEDTLKCREVKMRDMFGKDSRPLMVQSDVDVPKASIKIVEMPVGSPKDKRRIAPEGTMEVEEGWVDVPLDSPRVVGKIAGEGDEDWEFW